MDEPDFKEKIIKSTRLFYQSSDDKLRLAAFYVWGESGKTDFDKIVLFLEKALNDRINKVKSSIMGVLKKMGEKNPQPTLSLAKKFINHPDPEVRILILHGIKLGGRNHPEEILPLFYKLQNEVTPRVRNMIIHVIGQISYKEGCLEKVVLELIKWENNEMVKDSLEEIIK
ncbi:MAG: HEAT repeat domain-containing protein, partial [Methanobacteriaceae archaeon]|nr:HEAT repeat domain-containing protein [Methanobacteriaceae archaeon]